MLPKPKLESFHLIYLIISTELLGYLGNYYFLFDLFSHFQLQIFATCLVLLVYCFITQSKRRILAAAAVTLFVGIRIFGADFSGIYGPKPVANPDVYYMNSEFMNSDIDPIMNDIHSANPKHIALVELNESLFQKIKDQGKFKYSYYFPYNVLSFGFFTNDEVLEQETYFIGEYPVGYFRTAERSYFVVHPLPPMTPESYRAQKDFFQTISERVVQEEHFLLVGDFNSSPYSRVFQKYF